MVNATLVTLKLLDESDQENLPDPLCYYSSLRGYRLTQDSDLISAEREAIYEVLFLLKE